MHQVFFVRFYYIFFIFFPILIFGQVPDRILYNGKVLTVDDNFTITSAIAINGERILATGDDPSILDLADAQTEEINLEGKTVIPGFIDNHIHYLRGTNFAAYETRIHGVISHDEVLTRITARAEDLDPGEWVFIIGGWTEQQFADKPGGFTRAELDKAAPNNPVFIQRNYTIFYMNSLAEDILGPQLGNFYTGDSVMF